MGAAVEMDDLQRVRSYLLRTANNLLIGHLRKGDRLTSESDLAGANLLEKTVDIRADDPASKTETTLLRERIDQLASQLPEDQRIAFEEGVLKRCPYSEIASKQDWTVAKVKVCVYRARKHMMAGLKDYRS